MKNTLFKLSNLTFSNKNWLVNFVLILALILFIMPPGGEWNGNEENYLGLAWRIFSPEGLSQISALRDSANHRFLFEYLTAFSINHVGFEWTRAFGRIIVALLYSASLVTLFRNLKLSIIDSYTIILAFVYLGEGILGWEWFFQGFEAKTLAYPFVFFSFSSSLKKKFNLSCLLLIIATYFHFLIGVFWFFVTIIGHYWQVKNIRLTLFQLGKYLIGCLPLFSIIIFQQLPTKAPINSTEDVNWIYSYFRNAHHVAPFAELEQLGADWFQSHWYNRIFFLFGLTLISFVLYSYSENKKEKDFSRLIFTLNIYLVFSLGISYFDKNGLLGKFYLFRPSSVTLFLTLCFYVLYLKNRLSNNVNQLSFVALVLIGSLTIPNLQGHDLIISRVGTPVRDETPSYLNNLKLKQIIQSSNNLDIFLISPELEATHLSFERKYNRPTLVYRKFVPTTPRDIIRWYKLINMRKELFEKGCPAQIMEKYPVQYLLTESDRESVNSCGQELFKNQEVKLIKIQN